MKRKLENNPIYRSTKRVKYLGIHFTKEVKDLYTENYRTSMKEMEETSKWNDILHPVGLEDLITVNMSILKVNPFIFIL